MIKTYGVYSSDFEEVRDCKEILEYFADKDELQLDTETTGTDPHSDRIISLQLGDRDNQFFIDARNKNILEFKELIESKLCILQNAKFDYKMLKMAGIELDKIYDTMLSEVVCYCGYKDWGYGLDTLARRYLDLDLSKAVRATFLGQGSKPFSKDQVVYGCGDVTHLQDIRDAQRVRIKALDLEYCVDLENEVVKAIGDMELAGVPLSREKWMEIATQTSKEVEDIRNQLDGIVREDAVLSPLYKPKYVQGSMFEEVVVRDLRINYSSPIQIKKILHELGFKVESTEERELKKISKKHKFVAKLMELRTKEKIQSTYGVSFLENINPITNRIHTDFWQIVETGRLSSKEPNLQNIPAENRFRNCFVAPKGYKWVSCDYSGQELRIMADKSGEKGFLDVLNRGEDLHCYAGSLMFGKTITKADKEERYQAKTINFGKPYGMGPPKLADMLDITVEAADKLFKMYAKAFPVLNKWLERQGMFAKKFGYSLTFEPCKRRRFFPEMEEARQLRKTAKTGDKLTWKRILTIEGSTEREGGNSPIQGTGADICKEALIEVRKFIKDFNKKYGEGSAEMILTVHDEIDFLVREKLAEQFGKEVEKIMVECGNKYVSQVSMEVETTVTDFWYK